jgi:threonine synthase
VSEEAAKFDTLAVSIGTTRSTFQALTALRETDGTAVPVGNAGLIALQEELAETEGILAELTSVTPLAAIASLRRRNVIAETDSVVAIVTGSGLKDLDRSVNEGQRHSAFHSVSEALKHLGEDGKLYASREAEVWL